MGLYKMAIADQCVFQSSGMPMPQECCPNLYWEVFMGRERGERGGVGWRFLECSEHAEPPQYWNIGILKTFWNDILSIKHTTTVPLTIRTPEFRTPQNTSQL
ncbi:hypothetical protein E2C01_054485 [Portunus trituberculatus]|uniref:Uncharacterized protein n=1 Tax=Portunus trituberculatus TaxID=210409 RepID=A0A5B7GJP3_PORTR|nr:hypothetical protein [Portunus trituberculatus]